MIESLALAWSLLRKLAKKQKLHRPRSLLLLSALVVVVVISLLTQRVCLFSRRARFDEASSTRWSSLGCCSGVTPNVCEHVLVCRQLSQAQMKARRYRDGSIDLSVGCLLSGLAFRRAWTQIYGRALTKALVQPRSPARPTSRRRQL